MEKKSAMGAAAVETAMALPVVVIILFAGMSLGVSLMTRSRLLDAVNIMARSCAMFAQPNEDLSKCAQRYLPANLSGVPGNCATPQVQAEAESMNNNQARVLHVQASCNFSPLVVGVFNSDIKVVVHSTVPFPP